MKKFATLLVLLSVSLFTLGCGDSAAKKPAAPAKSPAPAAGAKDAPKADAPKADAPKADAPKADAPKADEKK